MVNIKCNRFFACFPKIRFNLIYQSKMFSRDDKNIYIYYLFIKMDITMATAEVVVEDKVEAEEGDVIPRGYQVGR